MTRRHSRPPAVAAALFVALGLMSGTTPAQAEPDSASGKSKHERIVDFWTMDKVRAAKSRDFVYDEATGSFQVKAAGRSPMAKPIRDSALGQDWTGGGAVQQTTGKVLFAIGTSYYVCSASVANDSTTATSVVLTAGHCVFDNESGVFSSNWMFVPDYDANPVALSGSGSFCAQTKYGCWTAQALVASSDFTAQRSFNTTATLHDYAFATLGAGGHGNTQLDATVGSQAISFATAATGAVTDLFGYPAARPYDGTRLIYSEGSLGFDSRNGNNTYRVASNMTGGSSGGPWFQGFSAGTGTMMSVNSYGYQRDTNMQGPKLGTETQGMYTTAQTATGNISY